MAQYLLRKGKIFYLVYAIFPCLPLPAWAWGFFGHKQINRYAITTLPPGMFAFYKAHLTYLTEEAVNPDKRRYVVKDEASKHFIDIEVYRATFLDMEKLFSDEVFKKYDNTTIPIQRHGNLPWAILDVHKKLTKAFKDRDLLKIGISLKF